MTREEAIKELRSFIGQLTEGCQEAIKVLIPELKEENEDERIRKAIIELLKEIGRDDTGISENVKCMIAYLEKQKEQKPAEWSGEDREMLYAMIDIVSNSLYEPIYPRDEMLSWLKSLRPSWKPSEEEEKIRLKLRNDGFEAGKERTLKQFSDILEKWEEHAMRGMKKGASAYHQGKISLICDLRDWIKEQIKK